ncbi:MAG: TonB-dependent receptor [Flavobacteriales bacterium]
MKNISFFLFSFFLITNSFAQQNTLSGFITDISNGESIVGANIYCSELSLGTTANTYGFYSLTLPKGSYEISYSFLGYKTKTILVDLTSDLQKNISFQNDVTEINEVVISSERNVVEKTQTSVVDIPIKQIKKIPALLGEVDIIKAIQLLPGVQSSEGTSGYYVRGGGPDQNLILMDGVPVYNASHLGGLFSVFNADAIKSVRLYKGGFPARFGGRLSSVLQIDMKEGNDKKIEGDASLGLISSKLTLEGPIIKNKTSFIVSGRRTYADVIAKPFINDNTDFSLYFYDLNTKVNHKFSDKDRLFLSAYAGNDIFSVNFSETDSEQISFGLGYGNITSTIRWNHLFNNKLFSNTTLTYSNYSFNTNFRLSSNELLNGFTETTDLSFVYKNGIEDLAARIDFDYSPNPNHEIKFGSSYTYHFFFPGQTNLYYNISSSDSIFNQTVDTTFNFSPNINAHEFFLYAEDNIRFSDRFKANIGLHLGYYSLANKTSANNVSFFEKFSDKSNFSFQPRLSARYLLNKDWSLKASYAKMNQNIHLLSNSSLGLPSDIWVPAIDSVPSQLSHQVAASINTNLKNGLYEISLESYYKTMSNLIAYKAGYSNLQSTESWESSIETNGIGESYGLEFFIQKTKGKATGWIGYTLSWTNRKFENINFGEWYPYKFDRRHDLSIVLSYKLSKKWDFSSTWVYGTGNALTFPQGNYYGLPQNDSFINLIESYGSRNSTRLNPYHRLDVGFTHLKRKKKFDRTLSFGAYNVYNRKNPFFAYITTENGNRVAKQVSLFPIIPSISYRIQF